MVEIKIPSLKCKRCGHEWCLRRPKLPKVCPKCKSPYWNKDYVRKVKKRRENNEGTHRK